MFCSFLRLCIPALAYFFTSKVHCGSAVRFGQALPGYLIRIQVVRSNIRIQVVRSNKVSAVCPRNKVTAVCPLRVEFLLKTESGYLRDAEVT